MTRDIEKAIIQGLIATLVVAPAGLEVAMAIRMA